MSKIIGIIGSRRRDTDEDYRQVYNEFKKWYDEGDKICSGGCPKGGDRFAEVIARKLGLTKENGGLIIHYPKKPPQGSPRWAWAKANFERNTLVANDSDVIIACVAPDRTGGTEDTIKKWFKVNENGSLLKIV
jgi:hypothetical protein